MENKHNVNSAAMFEELQLEREVDSNGTIRYFNKDGKLHRVYGPAVIWSNGDVNWHQNGVLHREDGPAVEWKDETKYYLHGYEFKDVNAYKIALKRLEELLEPILS